MEPTYCTRASAIRPVSCTAICSLCARMALRMAGAPSACRMPLLHKPLPQACIATTVQQAVSVATCLGAALIAATSAPEPSASPNALKLIVSRSCEWPDPVGLREVCGEVVEGRPLSRLADTAMTATPARPMASPRLLLRLLLLVRLSRLLDLVRAQFVSAPPKPPPKNSLAWGHLWTGR